MLDPWFPLARKYRCPAALTAVGPFAFPRLFITSAAVLAGGFADAIFGRH